MRTFGTFSPAFAAPIDGETVGTYLDDTALTTKVKAKLIVESDLKSLQIHVESNKGEVMLSGFVDSSAQKTKAEQVVKSSGAKSVKNDLVVRTAEKK
jgi:hyperosmotically inducible protein